MFIFISEKMKKMYQLNQTFNGDILETIQPFQVLNTRGHVSVLLNLKAGERQIDHRCSLH